MKRSTVIGIAAPLLALCFALLGWWIYQQSFSSLHAEAPNAYIDLNFESETRYPVHTKGIIGTPKVLVDVHTYTGQPGEVSCTTCHTTRTPNVQNRAQEDLDEFHQGLVFSHGQLSCLSCHNSEDYDTLRRADGTALTYENTMQLCAQCHGPQYRDYKHGSHGGMSGYWDLSRGPRTRNTCTACHDAHFPVYPQLIPVFPPKDVPERPTGSGH